MGLVLPLTVVHLWWLLVQRPKIDSTELPKQRLRRMVTRVWIVLQPMQILRSILVLRTVPGCLLAIAVAAPWYIAVGMATDGEFLAEFFWKHNVGRAVSSMEGHGGSIFFYPAALLVGTFPWSLWLIPILWWAIKAKRRGVASRTSVTLAAVWVGVTIGLFSFASTKLPSYITSCYPGVALIVGGFLRDFAADVRMPSRGWRMLAGGVAVVVAFGMATGLIWVSFAEALPLVGWVGCSSILLAMAGMGGWIVDWRNMPRLVPAIWLSAAVCLHIALFGIGTRTVDRYRSEVDMLTVLDAQTEGRSHWFGLGGMEPSWVYYLNQPISDVPIAMADQLENIDSWWRFVRESKVNEGDYLIVEGSLADRLTVISSRWTSGAGPLIEVARTERFLRPGDIVVYQFMSAPANLAEKPGEQTTVR